MIKYYVLNKSSDIWSDSFNTKREAEKELELNYDIYGLEGYIVEVEEK